MIKEGDWDWPTRSYLLHHSPSASPGNPLWCEVDHRPSDWAPNLSAGGDRSVPGRNCHAPLHGSAPAKAQSSEAHHFFIEPVRRCCVPRMEASRCSAKSSSICATEKPEAFQLWARFPTQPAECRIDRKPPIHSCSASLPCPIWTSDSDGHTAGFLVMPGLVAAPKVRQLA